MACGRAPITVMPTTTSEWVPTATAIPSNTPQPATATSVPATATTQPTATSAPTATATPDYVRVPEYTGPGAQKDKNGRALGGNWPIVNYSPTMVTGKVCPRVTKWNIEVFNMTNNVQAAVVADPCVAQNAIDDYVEIAWALPYHANFAVMHEQALRYRTAPEFQGRIVESWIKSFIDSKSYEKGFSYDRCDPPLVAVMSPTGRPFVDVQSGTVMEIEMLVTSIGFKATSCDILSYETGKILRTSQRTQEQINAKGIVKYDVQMFWDDANKHWKFGAHHHPGLVAIDVARAIYAKTGLPQ